MQAQINLIKSTQHLPLTCGTCRLLNPYSNSVASPEQEHDLDLLHFGSIGQDEYEKYIDYYILNVASTNPPLWKKKLVTLSERKFSKRQVSQLEDRKVCISAKVHA